MATTPPKELIESLKTLVLEVEAAVASNETPQPLSAPAPASTTTEKSEEIKSDVRGYNDALKDIPAEASGSRASSSTSVTPSPTSTAPREESEENKSYVRGYNDALKDMPIECADSPVTVIKDERSEDGTVGDGSEGTERRCYHCDGGDDHVDCRCRCSTEGERIASEAGTDIEEDEYLARCHPFSRKNLGKKSEQELREWFEMLSLPQARAFCNPRVTTVEALEALRGEIDRRYNIERREEREELRARAAAKDVKASHEGTDTDKDNLNSSPFTSKALSNKSDAVLEEWLQLFTQGFLRSSQIRVCKDPPVTAGEAVEALQTELARRRERRARDEELSADASASRHSKANQERTNAGKGKDIPTHPYFLSALKRKSDEELEEWIQIFSLPTTNILCNPPMTTTEALEAIRTELARRRESFAGPGMWGREEAPAYLEVSQNRRASEEGMDTEQDNDVQFHPYSPSALKRRSTRQLVEEVQILQLPWSTVISNPHITNAEALKALRTELGRRRVVEFRARREEAAARSETSREGTETGDDDTSTEPTRHYPRHNRRCPKSQAGHLQCQCYELYKKDQRDFENNFSRPKFIPGTETQRPAAIAAFRERTNCLLSRGKQARHQMRLEQEQRKNLRDREETPREDFERKRALVHQRWMEDFRAKRRAAMVENIQSKIRDINHLEKVQRRAEAIRAERPPPSAPFDHLDRQDQEFRARMRGWYRQGYRDPLIEAIRDQPSVTPAQAQKAYYEARAPGWNWSRLIEEQNQILLERRETMLRRRNEIRNAQQAQGLYPLYPGIWPPYVCQEPVEGEQCNCEQCEDNREYYVDGDEFENN